MINIKTPAIMNSGIRFFIRIGSSMIIILFALPQINAQCLGGTTSISGLPSNAGCGNGGSIQWDGAVGGTGAASGTVTWTSTGTFRLKRFYPGGCTYSPTVLYSPYYTVGPQPAGPAASEVTQEHSVGSVLLRYIGSAGNAFWQTSATETDETYPTTRTVTSTGTYYARIKNGTNCWSTSTVVTVTNIPQPPAGPTGYCVGNTTTVSSSLPLNVGCGDGNPISWDGPAGGTGETSGTVTWQNVGTFRLKRTFPGGCTNSPSVIYSPYYTVGPQPAGPAASEVIQQSGCGSVILRYTGSSSNTFWQSSQDGTDETYPSARTVISPGAYYARIKNSTYCWSTPTAVTVITISEPSNVVPLVDYKCIDGANLMLTSDELGDRWFESMVSSTPLSSNNSITTTRTPKTLYLERVIPGICTLRTPYEVDYTFDLKCAPVLNSIKVTKTLERTNLVTVSSQLSETITYFDGLGRDIQNVNAKGSPLQKDIVKPIVYDLSGREDKKYLPFVSFENNGSFKAVTFSPSGNYAGDFYNNSANKIVDDTRPFSETIFEPSPLNRPSQDFGVGQNWKDNNKFIHHQYFVNVNGTLAGQEQIIAWKVDASGLPIRDTAVNSFVSGGHYTTGQLNIKSTKDEQGNEVREYVDKEGRTILKKVQAVSGIAQTNNDTHWAMTYYIYDDFGNLSVVLPPEAVKAITAQ